MEETSSSFAASDLAFQPAAAEAAPASAAAAPEPQLAGLRPGPTESWQEALTRRVRTLVRTTPLHQIELSKGHLAIDVARLDLRSCALRVLDVVIESMGLGLGAEREEVLQALRPMVRGLDPTLTAENVDAVAVHVLEAMLNERERRTAFSQQYADWQEAPPVLRQAEFHLLREEERPDGSVCLRATTEGINLYTGMLDFAVQDAQVAEEAVLRAQIRRGRVDDAVKTARNARLRSIELQQQIEGLVRLARRDVTQLRWAEEVLGLLDEALDHIDERIGQERELLGMVAQREDAASPEDAPKLATLHKTLDDCMHRHMQLHRRVLAANREFLDEQERQAFRPRMLLPLPDPEAELLRPALELTEGALQQVLGPIVRALFPARAQPLLYLPQLVGQLLAPSRAAPEQGHEPEEVVLEFVEAMAPFYDADDLAAARELVQSAVVGGGTTRLSEVLANARFDRVPVRLQQLAVLLVLEAFDPDCAGDGLPLAVEPARSVFDGTHFCGDDLLLSMREALPAGGFGA